MRPAATPGKPRSWWCSPFVKGSLKLTASVGALTGPEGATLPAESLSLRLVDYVPAAGHLQAHAPVRRWPDILRPLPPDGFETAPGENRCLWLTVQVPAAALPGEYRGQVTLTESGGDTAAVPVHLTVHRLALPAPSQWAFRVDFWQACERLARQYQVAEWSEEWWAIARTYLADLAAHGQSVVQVGRRHFDWTLTPDGGWQFGFDRFDRYVQECGRLGIAGPIEYLQMFDGRGDTRLYYTDATGKAQTLTANPGDKVFDEAWLAFARALAAHCREQGWLERLYVCPTDEPQDVYGQPTIGRFKHCADLLKQADPGHRTTVALDSLAAARDLAPSIDRFVFKLREDVYDRAFAAQQRERGKLVETYICCHPDRPNSFITSPAIEPRVIGWLCWQEQLQGLLRWSYMNWPAAPLTKPEGDGAYAPGDLFCVYPGDRAPLSSPRWERLREGFQDWEMLRAAEQLVTRSRALPVREAAREVYEQALAAVAGPPGKLTAYTTDPEAFGQQRRALLEALDKLVE